MKSWTGIFSKPHWFSQQNRFSERNLFKAQLVSTKKRISEKTPLRRVRDMKPRLEGDVKTFFAQAREMVAKESKGYPAPLVILGCAEAAATLPFDEGRKVERDGFAQLVATDESKAL